MKWFHHECAARHDPKLQMLGDAFGVEGLGIYWSLLEEIGAHSDTFHLKLIGNSEESDKMFATLLDGQSEVQNTSFSTLPRISSIPRIPMRLLARQIFTTLRKLQSVIALAVEIELFDSTKWLKYNVLYSPSFEHRADDYTRRQHRKPESRQTPSEHSSGVVHSDFEHAPNPLRTESEDCSDGIQTNSAIYALDTEEEQKETERRTREEKDFCSAERQTDISTPFQQAQIRDHTSLIQLNPEDLARYSESCLDILRQWNATHRTHFQWIPAREELTKLLLGGQRDHKIRLCFQAINLQGGEVRYAELVLRAIRLMLRASLHHRIANPFGWLWSCLHGNGDGATPWVALLSADEESHSNRPP